MAREKRAGLSVDHVKTRYRPVFVAWHGAARRHPGGVTELAHQAGRSPIVLANRINPNCYDHVPTVEDLLFCIESMQAVDVVAAIALLVQRVTVPLPDVPRAPREVVRAFMELAKRAGDATALAADALGDGRLDADERERLAPLLDALLQATVEFAAVVRGG